MLRKISWLKLSLVGFCLTGCALQERPPFEPILAQKSERTGSEEIPAMDLRPIPLQMEKRAYLTRQEREALQNTALPYGQGSIDLRMSLQEIIHRTAMNNLDVKVAGYEPAIEQTRGIEADARFDPTLFTNVQYQRTEKNNGGSFDSFSNFGRGTSRKVSIEHDLERSVETGVKQLLETGGQIEGKIKYGLTQADPPRSFTNPFAETEISLQLTQPLLQNFGLEVNRARITISRNNQRVSTLEFRKTLEEQLLEAEKTYWQLVQAQAEVTIQEKLLEMTLKTSNLLADRMNGGQDVTRVQTSQAEASVESRRATLVRSRARVRDLSDKIKQLMNDPEISVSSSVVIVPATLPTLEPIHFDAVETIKSAMENRLELGQQQLRIDSAGIASEVAKNNLLPQLNLVGQVTRQGLGHSGMDSIEDLEHTSWSIGLQLEIPLGNRAARAIWQRALLQRQQAIDSYRSLINQISLDVTQALREIETSWNEIIATRQARFAADDALKAIQQREDNNEPLTYNFVQLKLDTQERLSNALQAEQQSINNYNLSIARLEKAKGTLLKFNNVIMEEDGSPFNTRTKINVSVEVPSTAPATTQPMSNQPDLAP